MKDTDWQQLSRTWRLTIGHFDCDVWGFLDFDRASRARYSVLDRHSGSYIAGGKCIDIDTAKQVSSGLARSLTSLV